MIAHILAPALVTTLFLVMYVPRAKRCEKEKACKEEYEKLKKAIEKSSTEAFLRRTEAHVDQFKFSFKRIKHARSYCAELHALIKNQRQRTFSNN